MTNPLLLFRAMRPRPPRPRKHQDVEIPTAVPTTDAMFMALRRMRVPMLVIIGIFTVCVAGLAAIPGQDEQGNPARMSVFDAFYFASYTATTIGFGEVPHAFTTAQRMWVTLSIYLLVIGWAYAVGSLLALVQDPGFRESVATQRFRRRVLRLREPFALVAGYGGAGRTVCEELDADGHRIVVVERDRARVERLAGDQLSADVPGLEADASNPAVLGLAGLDHKRLSTVLALTDDDEANLAVVMAVNLLRPDVPCIARVHDRRTEERMADFAPAAVINPNDRYGGYLVMAVQKPATYRLVTWLMAREGTRMPQDREALVAGRWVVCADGQFGQEVADDLRRSGLDVTLVDPSAGHPDLTGVAGFLAGTDRDLTNIALAEHAKVTNPDIFVAVRQRSSANATLLQALDVESVYLPTEVVASEALARVSTPMFWGFIEHAMTRDEAWSKQLLDRLRARCGAGTPDRIHVELTHEDAPAVMRWLGHDALTIGDLVRDPDDRDERLAVVPLVLVRHDGMVFAPSDDEPLARGDELLLAGSQPEFAALHGTLFYDAQVEYVATGREVPTAWVWRALTRTRRP